MATETQQQRTIPRQDGHRFYRLTVEQLLKMLDAGVFPAQNRVELLGGILVEKMTKKSPHDYAVDFLGKFLERLLYPAWIAREEKSVVLSRHWRPEPDIAILRGPRSRYANTDPVTADIAILIEVADTSAAKDRTLKWKKYAACRIPQYWLIHVGKSRLEVFTKPVGKGAAAKYQEVKSYGPKEEVPVVIEGVEVGRVPVSEVLPPRSS